MPKDQMTHRERFLTAVRNEVPDRVPACPCLSNMVPVRRTGRPFWEVYLHKNPPLWKAYLDTARYFDLDARLIYGGLRFSYDIGDVGRVETGTEVVSRSEEQIVTRTVESTPHGQLTSETVYQAGNPPTTTVKPIKDIRRDLPAFKCLFPLPTGYTADQADAMRRAAGEDAVFCLSLGYPGFHAFADIFDGGLPRDHRVGGCRRRVHPHDRGSVRTRHARGEYLCLRRGGQTLRPILRAECFST